MNEIERKELLKQVDFALRAAVLSWPGADQIFGAPAFRATSKTGLCRVSFEGEEGNHPTLVRVRLTVGEEFTSGGNWSASRVVDANSLESIGRAIAALREHYVRLKAGPSK